MGDGLVLTVAHAVTGSSSVSVTAADGTVGPATVVGVDEEADLALLHADIPGASPPDIAAAVAGDTLRMVGAHASGTTAAAVVRAVDITIDAIGDDPGHRRYGYELDAATATGDSGAGLYDRQGRLVGVVFATSTGDGAGDGTGSTWATAGGHVRDLLDRGPGGPWTCDPGASRIVPPAEPATPAG